MSDTVTGKPLLSELSCCVVIPTYNNSGTLLSVIDSVRPYTTDIIVVNDGSTDQTAKLLENVQGITVLTNPVNQGKGYSLRKAFRYASSKGFNNAVSIDSDGQHFGRDIPKFAIKYKVAGSAMIIGERTGKQVNKPKKNIFANAFSNFWFRVQTGLNLPDTQSGFRWYPLDKMAGTRYFSTRYEFELEVLVRCAWKGIPIYRVPVEVYYGPKEEMVSHYRPFIDFMRISILNTILTILALFFFRPKLFIRNLFS